MPLNSNARILFKYRVKKDEKNNNRERTSLLFVQGNVSTWYVALSAD